ncbi:hypothetical protein EV175_000111 [Coemansia sp. RSA 1933]|nr:hypothetical protein EV175_000111 [Coemansia sp. RSA 1933]
MALMGSHVVAHDGPHSTDCTPGTYRCHGPGGKSAAFLQCDVNRAEILMSCAPGTVCYAQGTDSILCSYPVDMASAPPPASDSLVSGAQCSALSPFDEYMCPGSNGQHNYYLRCLSGTYVHFPCPPGTTCHKTEGQNMFCGLPDGGISNASASLPPPSSSSSSLSLSSSSSSQSVSSMEMPMSSVKPTIMTTGLGMGDTETELSVISSSTDTVGVGSSLSSSSSSSGWFDDLPPLDTDSTSSSSSGSSSSKDSSSSVPSSSLDSLETSPAIESTPESTSGSTSEPTSEVATPEASPSSAEETSTTATSSNSPAGNTGTGGSSGLTGPVISSGLEMLLNNGVKLPFTLPNIDLPEINLATVHLPDLTFGGIALTAIPLPSVTVPPLNPASLTQFTYIESIMSHAGISFDDLAKLKLPDLSHIDMSGLSNIDPAMIISLMNVNRAPVPTDQANANDIAGPVPTPTASLQTTTLGTDAIDALLGLSVSTYASPS